MRRLVLVLGLLAVLLVPRPAHAQITIDSEDDFLVSYDEGYSYWVMSNGVTVGQAFWWDVPWDTLFAGACTSAGALLKASVITAAAGWSIFTWGCTIYGVTKLTYAIGYSIGGWTAYFIEIYPESHLYTVYFH